MFDNSTSDGFKVCHLISPGHMGGAEKVVLAGCAALGADGTSVELAVIREARFPALADAFLAEATERKIRVFDGLKSARRIDTKLFCGLRRYLRDGDFQVLHTHGYKALLYGSYAGSSSLKIVHTHHGDTARGLTVKCYQWLAYRRMKSIDAVCAVSQPMLLDFQKKGIRSDRLHLVENMLATPIDDVSCIEERGHISSKTAELELVAIGRLSVEKGLDILIEALAAFPIPRPKLTIVGQGPQENELKSLVNERGLAQDVIFAGFHKDVRGFLAKADAFVMPSLREGFPLSLIEAVSWGLPVIATNVGGIPNAVENGKNGLLCAPDDSEAFRKCLLQLVADPHPFQVAARAIAPEIRKRFSPATWATTTRSVYNCVLSPRA